MAGDNSGRDADVTTLLSGIGRMHGSARFLVASVIVVGVALALLRIVYAPSEEALLASIEAAQQAEERARAGSSVAAPPTPTAAVAVTEAASSATASDATAAQAATAEATPGQPTATAASATPEPTAEATYLALGETATSDTNLQITLVDVYTVPSIPQYFGRDFMPTNGVYVIVVARFRNPTSALIQYSPERVNLIDDSGASFGYDDAGTNGLSTTPKPANEGRPLMFASSLHAGSEETVSIVFDLESAADELRVQIEDLVFEAAVREVEL